jgi:hypothetical protein
VHGTRVHVTPQNEHCSTARPRGAILLDVIREIEQDLENRGELSLIGLKGPLVCQVMFGQISKALSLNFFSAIS